MLQEFSPLLAATLLFVLGHFLLSSRALRQPLIERLGAKGFQALYSLVVLAAFVWMLWSYRTAYIVEQWAPPAWARWVPLLSMPLACILTVAAFTTPNPTLVGGEKLAAAGGRGIMTITRHPFLWGATLWALSHLAVRGDWASIILMGGILALSLGGMLHIDRRRAAAGADWGPMAMTTSAIPFAAVFAGRTKIDWQGIGWWRPLLGLGVYALLLVAHETLIGVPLL